jgi:hypothetical protein
MAGNAWQVVMRLSLFIIGVFAAVVCVEKPAEAQSGAAVLRASK